MGQQGLDGKSWYSIQAALPLIDINFSETRNLLLCEGTSLGSFSVLWDNNLSTGNRDTPYFLPPRPLISKKFVDTKFFTKRGRVRLRISSVMWQKRIRRKIVIPPRLSLIFSIPHMFLSTEEFLYGVFWSCETQSFWREVVKIHPLYLHKIFRYPNFPEIRKVSLRTLLLLWGRTIATKNRDTRSLISIISWYQKFCEEKEEFPYEVLRACETKSISREVVIIQPPSYSWDFSLPKVS